MTREKIIDEIRNYVKENAEMGWVNADEVLRKINEVIPSRLVPEGSVVLTKEEYEELKNLDVSYDALEDQYLNLMKKAGEVRKETKREVVKKLSGFRFVMYDEFDDGHEVASWTCDEDDVKRFAKEIGVEVEE